MEENAQLRAEKMLIASNPTTITNNNISQNINNLFYAPNNHGQSNSEETGILYINRVY